MNFEVGGCKFLVNPGWTRFRPAYMFPNKPTDCCAQEQPEGNTFSSSWSSSKSKSVSDVTTTFEISWSSGFIKQI